MFKIIIYFSGFKPALVQSEINSFWLQLHSALTFLQVRLRFQLFAKFGINRKGWSQIPPALKNWYVPTSVPIWHLINSVSLLELEVSSSFWLFLFFLLLFSSLPNWHDIKENNKSQKYEQPLSTLYFAEPWSIICFLIKSEKILKLVY